jgi:sulfate transport system ATP-binding protein
VPLGDNGFQPGAEALGFVRPHELDIGIDLSDRTGIEARVERVLALGATARIELIGINGGTDHPYEVELSRERAAALALNRGQIVRLKPARIRLFAPDSPLAKWTPPGGSLIGVDGEGI